MGYWYVHEESLFATEDGYRLREGAELTLFHFSGLDPDSPQMLSKWQNRLDLRDHPGVATVIAKYICELNGCGRAYYERLGYRYATLSSGVSIPSEWREAVRRDHPELDGIEDPFDVRRYPDLPRRFRRAVPKMTLYKARFKRISKRMEGAARRLCSTRRKAA